MTGPSGPATAETPGPQTTGKTVWRDPTRLGLALTALSAACGLAGLLGALVAITRGAASVGLIAFCAATLGSSALAGYLSAQLLVAKQRALAGRPNRLLFGLARLALWRPNEGVILLRDRRVIERHYGDESGGGLRVIYPVLGEELQGPIPLAVQLTWFEDRRVLTRESIPLTVKVALWWRVSNLERYAYKISPEIHAIENEGLREPEAVTSEPPSPRGPLWTAGKWVRTLAESSLRTLLSDTSTAQIVSQRAASYLHVEHPDSAPQPAGNPSPGGATPHLMPATPDAIARWVKATLDEKVVPYGLEVERVEIQEVQLPPGLQEAVDAVWAASTLPAKASKEADARKIHLQAVVDVLGREAAAANEIVRNLQAGTYLGNPVDLLRAVFDQLGPRSPAPSPGALPSGQPTAAGQLPRP
jgi:regulator of protease activity HflC (stomatin/prohibitin superfamily)